METETQATETAEEIQLVEWIFTGQRVSRKDKRLYAWVRKDQIDTPMYYPKQIVPASVGGVYLFHETVSSFYTGGDKAPKYVRQYEDKAKVTKWAIKDERARQELSIKSMNTKASKVKPLDDALEDIATMSCHLNSSERLALIAKVSEVILNA